MYPEIRMVDQKSINKFLRTAPYARSTQEGYSWILARVARWLAKERLSFEELDGEDLLRFLDSQKTWGASIRSMAHKAVRAYVKWAYGEEHPVLALRMRRPGIKPQRTLDESEIIQLIGYLEKKVNMADTDNRFNRAIRNLAMVCLLLDAGLRAGELCSLKAADLDLEKRQLQVVVKGGEWEYGKFSQYAAAQLEDWLTVREALAAPGVPYVFVGILGATPGQQMTTSGLRTLFRKMARRSGLPHFSTHAFRRSGATLATISGGPSRTVRMAWRWKTEQQLDRYTQMLPLDTIEPYLPLNQIDTESLRGSVWEELDQGADRKKDQLEEKKNVTFID